jgi:hypothetical protein
MSPGVDGNASATVLPMMYRSPNTAPGVLALTETRSAGRSYAFRMSTKPAESPNEGIGWPVFRSSA